MSAPKVTKSNSNSNRVNDIATNIRQAFSPILQGDDDAASHRDAAKAATDGAFGSRETVIINVANLSATERWSEKEIDIATKLVVERNNDKSRKKSLETLCGEVRNAAHPKVRNHVAAIFAAVKDAWDAEAATMGVEGFSRTDRPVMTAFSRRYHAITGCFKQARDGKVMTTAAAISEHAQGVLLARRLDVKKVHGRLQSIVRELTKFHHDFSLDDIGLSIESLNRIDEARLKAWIDANPATVVSGSEDDAGDEPDNNVSDSVSESAPEPVTSAADELENVVEDLLSGNIHTLELAA